MLRVAERPVMDYVLERMQSACCDEIRVVTRPEKRDVADNARSSLDGLARYAEPGYHFDALAAAGPVHAVFLSDSWIDIGTPEVLAEVESR